MQIKHGDKKKIQAWLRLKQSDFSGYINGRRRPKPHRARDLENISGVPLRDWLFLDYKKLADKIYMAWKGRINNG